MKLCFLIPASVALTLTLQAISVSGYSSGAPIDTAGICEHMTPPHRFNGAITSPQKSQAPYKITVDNTNVTPGQITGIILSGSGSRSGSNKVFKGLLAMGRRKNFLNETASYGKFLKETYGKPSEEVLLQKVECFGRPDSAVTHNSGVDKNKIEIEWEAPQEIGEYVIVATFVATKEKYWTQVTSDVITVVEDDDDEAEVRSLAPK